MGKESFHVEGLEGVLDALKKLPAEVGAKCGGPAKAALRKGANVIRDLAINNAPRASGFMASQIATSRDSKPQLVGATEHFWVGVRRGKSKRYANTKRNRGRQRAGKTYQVDGNAYYWKFLEFGTEKMKAQPFLRPAFESRKEDALNVIVAELRAGIDRAAKKLRKR
ncbi:MAG: HK97-gp10 family putative phage morphogenesis protein [Burkholderiaceae bacterium]